MPRIFIRITLIVALFLTAFVGPVVPSSAQAQTSSFSSVRRNIATIIFCGLGGAVLGISTLSFYGEPQEHIGNITTGLAIGTIVGVAYVTTQVSMEQQAFKRHDLGIESFAKMKSIKSPILVSWTF
jgi:hypothetical protein